jgi:hypothetical protein
VPVVVEGQPGSAAAANRQLTVEVSYDDGATWRPVPVTRVPGGGMAVLHHPTAAGFVSLRAVATDTAGNTVEETILRAYRTVVR